MTSPADRQRARRPTKADLLAENEQLRTQLAESQDVNIKITDDLQALCAEHGCQPGHNRIGFLRERLADLAKG